MDERKEIPALPCGIVQDLLPVYADGAAGEETRTALEKHLESCGECRRMLRDMRSGVPEPEEIKKDRRQVRFLKKLRRRSVMTGVISFVCAAVLGLMLWAGTTRGIPVSREDIELTSCTVEERGETRYYHVSIRIKGLGALIDIDREARGMDGTLFFESEMRRGLPFILRKDNRTLIRSFGFDTPEEIDPDRTLLVLHCEDGDVTVTLRELEALSE